MMMLYAVCPLTKQNFSCAVTDRCPSRCHHLLLLASRNWFQQCP